MGTDFWSADDEIMAFPGSTSNLIDYVFLGTSISIDSL